MYVEAATKDCLLKPLAQNDTWLFKANMAQDCLGEH